jgi:hypothetical protein
MGHKQERSKPDRGCDAEPTTVVTTWTRVPQTQPGWECCAVAHAVSPGGGTVAHPGHHVGADQRTGRRSGKAAANAVTTL